MKLIAPHLYFITVIKTWIIHMKTCTTCCSLLCCLSFISSSTSGFISYFVKCGLDNFFHYYSAPVHCALVWTPSKENSVSVAFPLCSTPSTQHHCSLCRSSLLRHTLPNPPSIYLPMTFSASSLCLSPDDPRNRCIRHCRSYEQGSASGRLMKVAQTMFG